MDQKELIVIKIGGALVKEGISNLIDDIKELVNQYEIIVVHGGGPQINELYEKLGKSPKIFKTPKGFSTRHTDPEAIDIIKMALAGYVNKTIVEQLQKVGVNAFGFSAADGRVITAERKEKIIILTDKGKKMVLRDEYSGKNPRANTDVILNLLKLKMVPIIGSLSISHDGDLINMDGDRVANSIASALKAKYLISLTDVEGVYENLQTKKIINKIKLAETEFWLNKLSGGMKKKLYAAAESLKKGINQVIITSGSVEKPLSRSLKGEIGTRVVLE